MQRSNYFTHWNYFLSIEKDLEKISRYVEFSKDNWTTYSIEIARIILASASDTDVLLKALCKRVSPGAKAKSINKYMDVIKKIFPDIPAFEVSLPRWGLNFIPWSDWASDEVPAWWTANNKIKHHRDKGYHRANLLNALKAVAGLYVINLYFYKKQAVDGKLLPMPLLLRPSKEHFNGTTFNDVEFSINYKL